MSKSPLTGQDYPSEEGMKLMQELKIKEMKDNKQDELPWPIRQPFDQVCEVTDFGESEYAIVPIEQARALYDAAKMIIELEKKYRIWHIDSSPYFEFHKAIDLLRKGIDK